MCQTKADGIIQEMMWLKSKGLLTEKKRKELQAKLEKERAA